MYLDLVEDFRNREDSDHHRNHTDSGIERALSEYKSGLAFVRVHAYAADQQSESCHQQTFRQRLAAHRSDDRKSEDCQRKVFRRSEIHRKLRDQRRDEQQRQSAQKSTDYRYIQAVHQRVISASFLRHAISVRDTGDRRRRTRRLYQDRRDGTAIYAAAVSANQQDNSGGCIQTESKGKHQRHSERRAESGQRADNNADRHSDKHTDEHFQGNHIP